MLAHASRHSSLISSHSLLISFLSRATTFGKASRFPVPDTHPKHLNTMTMQHSPSDIYVTKLDYERLSLLVRREHSGGSTSLAATLEQELSRAHLVDSYDILPDVITMNSRLKLRAMNNGEELHFTLVYPHDADETSYRVSILNPVGMAVLGCRLGDKVQLQQVKGVSTYWVEAILHQPEAAGDWVS